MATLIVNKKQHPELKHRTDLFYPHRVIASFLVILLLLGLLLYTGCNHKEEEEYEEVYQSTVKLYVQIEDKDNNNTMSSSMASQRVGAYQIVLKSRTTLEEAIENIKETYPNYSRSYGALNGMVDTSVDGETEIFTVKVTSQSKEEAYLVAKAIVTVMQERISALFGQSAKVVVIDDPVIPETPIRRPIQKND